MRYHQPENTFPLVGMKNFTEKDVAIRRKKTTTGAGVWFVLKNRLSPNFINSFHQQKKTRIKKNNVSYKQKNTFPLAEMKDWLKNMIQLKEKLLPLATVDCKMRK